MGLVAQNKCKQNDAPSWVYIRNSALEWLYSQNCQVIHKNLLVGNVELVYRLMGHPVHLQMKIGTNHLCIVILTMHILITVSLTNVR